MSEKYTLCEKDKESVNRHYDEYRRLFQEGKEPKSNLISEICDDFGAGFYPLTQEGYFPKEEGNGEIAFYAYSLVVCASIIKEFGTQEDLERVFSENESWIDDETGKLAKSILDYVKESVKN